MVWATAQIFGSGNLMKRRLYFIICLLLGMHLQQAVASGIGINTTRVIYHQQDQSVQVSIRNTTKETDFLVRAALLNKDGLRVNEFEILPPLFRLNAESEGAVRVIKRNNTHFPDEQESLFYFYALAIPSTTKEWGGDKKLANVKVGLGNKIKFIYRPANLSTPDRNIYQRVLFHWGQNSVRVDNPTPYFISMSSLNIGGVDFSFSKQGSEVLAPFSYQNYPCDRNRVYANQLVHWEAIDDLGAIESISTSIK